jgi:hypothetical protein
MVGFPMPQRDWGSLSPRTQKSYTGTGAKQFGWTPAQVRAHYESGESLKGLRRHTNTPEKPEYAAKNPTAFPGYRRSGGETLNVIGRDGRVGKVEHLSKAERTLVAKHHNAIQRYLEKNETHDRTNADGKLVRGLDYFAGKMVNGVELETRKGALEDLEMRGDLAGVLNRPYPEKGKA